MSEVAADSSAKKVSLVAAIAGNRAIGLRGSMPWHLPDELRYFKKVTLGKPVIMGRKTHQSIGMVLPGRQNIILTRDRNFSAAGCDIAASLEAAIDLSEKPECMVIGGGEIYRQAIPLAGRMYLTVVDCLPEADTFFPDWSSDNWQQVSAIAHPADADHQFAFEMQEWIRTRSA